MDVSMNHISQDPHPSVACSHVNTELNHVTLPLCETARSSLTEDDRQHGEREAHHHSFPDGAQPHHNPLASPSLMSEPRQTGKGTIQATPEPWELINLHLKPLHLRVACYTAVGNWYRQPKTSSKDQILENCYKICGSNKHLARAWGCQDLPEGLTLPGSKIHHEERIFWRTYCL